MHVCHRCVWNKSNCCCCLHHMIYSFIMHKAIQFQMIVMKLQYDKQTANETSALNKVLLFVYFGFIKFLLSYLSSCIYGMVGIHCVTCLLFKFCMASPGLPCPRPCPGRLLLARGSFRLGEGRNGDGGVSSDRTPSWTRKKLLVIEKDNRYDKMSSHISNIND